MTPFEYENPTPSILEVVLDRDHRCLGALHRIVPLPIQERGLDCLYLAGYTFSVIEIRQTDHYVRWFDGRGNKHTQAQDIEQAQILSKDV